MQTVGILGNITKYSEKLVFRFGLTGAPEWKRNTTAAVPTIIYLFKDKNGKTRVMCEVCSSLAIKKSERRQRLRDFKHYSSVSVVDLEQINTSCVFFSLRPLVQQLKLECIRIFQNHFQQDWCTNELYVHKRKFSL